MRRGVLGLFVLLGCRVVAEPAPPVPCPEPDSVVVEVPIPAAPHPGPVPAPQPEPEADPQQMDLEWGSIEVESLRPRRFGEITITVIPTEHVADDGSVVLSSRVTVADERGDFAGLDSPVDTGLCGADLFTSVDDIGYGTPRGDVFDARLTCSVGESNHRRNTAHTVIAVDPETRTATLLTHAEAPSWVVADESQDIRKLRFFIEANTLAVYEERSAWCDADALFEAHGIRERGCKVRPRTLKLKQRIEL